MPHHERGNYNRHAHVHHRVGEWMPKNHADLESWLAKKIKAAEHNQRTQESYKHPVIGEFRDLIENDPEICMAFHQMFEEVPSKPPYNNDPSGKPQVRDYHLMLSLFDIILEEAPSFEENNVILPINAILDWPMGTPAGYRAFVNPRVNEMFHKMFNVWAKFLSSPESRNVLTNEPGGWFSPAASEAIPNFEETFECDPSAPYHGFKCWDDFFTRRFRPGARPIELPDDDSVINSACESKVYKTAHGVKKHDAFWLKSEPYSLAYMLNNDPLHEQFIGGSIWQAFLSALKYHRWASPVNGKIVKTVNVPGTFYAESPVMGFTSESEPSASAMNHSQSFITSVAARALIFIEADNPKIGLMCFVGVGMGEVSTCEVTVKPGDRVKKGDQLGMFHFGGSTHCLIFRPETNVQFSGDFPPQTDVKLNQAIATVPK
ncbi:hypothetical protein D9613_004914 [Agrocybe pediades]|uniref:L-tryptophan decarboxylase PsiD-like domain-containing protein n=1 Tax=Agrocybe pediades TaxID=84607 RepID=A0A8H4QXD5_9AGAR|nr:hypothetical protein D9613_004914 [Agrocybe pediades]